MNYKRIKPSRRRARRTSKHGYYSEGLAKVQEQIDKDWEERMWNIDNCKPQNNDEEQINMAVE